MKIVLLQPYITTFAASSKAYNVQSFGLAQELSTRGHQVTIITSNIHIKKDQQKYTRFHKHTERIEGFEVVYLPTLPVLFKQPFMPSLVREIARIKPDIIQAAEDYQLSTLFVTLWKLFSKTGVCVYQGTYHYFSRKKTLHKLYMKTLARIVHQHADMFICKTRAAKSYLSSHKVGDEKLSIIPPGFNKTDFYYERSKMLHQILGVEEGKILLNVGRLVPEKNQKVLVQALYRINQRHDDIYLAILGEGPEQDMLSALIKEFELENKAFIIGEKIPNDRMHEVYSDSYLNLIPSTYEPFNMSMLESLACGLPVIANNEGGMADVIQDGQTGYLLDCADPELISERILVLLKDRQAYDRLRKNAAQSSQQYEWGNLVQRYLHIYGRYFQHA